MATKNTVQSSEINTIRHPWKIIESTYSPELAAHYASLFSLANGYVGMRGSHEDQLLPNQAKPDGIRGTYINGFYETSAIAYGERAYGFADVAETMQNIMNPLPIQLTVDEEIFDLDQVAREGRLESYERSLAMSYGQLERRLVWITKQGKRVRLDSRRLVSQNKMNTACQVYRVTVLDAQGADFEIRSGIDGFVTNKSGGDDPRLASHAGEQTLQVKSALALEEDQLLYMKQETVNSGLSVAAAVAHRSNMRQCEADNSSSERVQIIYSGHARSLETLELNKYISFVDSRTIQTSDLEKEAMRLAVGSRNDGYFVLREELEQYLDHFWAHAQIQLKGDLSLQQGLNFSLFQLLQSAARDGRNSIAAKGLSGEGYEGHYFWDTEMYMLPFFTYTQPAIARALLSYRYQILDQARDRARLMGHSRGALFPWRGISGRECSAYFPAGTAQKHINGDICLAVYRYWEASGDNEFLWEMGAEILIEAAVFYLDLGFLDPKKGFVIHEVTGPDEYSALVNNNFFTNLIVKTTLEYAAEVIRFLDQSDGKRLQSLLEKITYDKEGLLVSFDEAAEATYLPYDENLDLPLQDDSFIERKPWDFLTVPKENYPLLLHYHPLVIYRHRVSKQPDLLLAQYLRPDLFTFSQRAKSYDYYELFTTHDSSLSASVHSIMANCLGRPGKAYRYFMETARLDLDNTHGNTADGLHMANMAGNWLAMVSGYAGMQIQNGMPHFKPQLPDSWDSYEFRFNYRGSLLSVRVQAETVLYKLLEGEEISFSHYGETLYLTQKQNECTRPIQAILPSSDEKADIKAVIFDVDGVLLSTDEEHYLAWKRLADEESIYFDRTINSRLRGVSRLDCVDIILERSEKQHSKAEKLELATRKNKYYREAIAEVDRSHRLPGVVEFLDDLKLRGIPLASASSSKNAATLLKACQLEHYFKAQVDGTHIERSKPDPQVFLLAAEALDIPPENCLVLEDAEAGIEAAKLAGMRSIALGKIAGNYLNLGADLGAWGLDLLHAEDIL